MNMRYRMRIALLMLLPGGCSTTPFVAPTQISTLPPVECLMTCPELPTPAFPNDLPAWSLRAVHAYELCAVRHNDCATKLEQKNAD